MSEHGDDDLYPDTSHDPYPNLRYLSDLDLVTLRHQMKLPGLTTDDASDAKFLAAIDAELKRRATLLARR